MASEIGSKYFGTSTRLPGEARRTSAPNASSSRRIDSPPVAFALAPPVAFGSVNGSVSSSQWFGSTAAHGR